MQAFVLRMIQSFMKTRQSLWNSPSEQASKDVLTVGSDCSCPHIRMKSKTIRMKKRQNQNRINDRYHNSSVHLHRSDLCTLWVLLPLWTIWIRAQRGNTGCHPASNKHSAEFDHLYQPGIRQGKPHQRRPQLIQKTFAWRFVQRISESCKTWPMTSSSDAIIFDRCNR